MSAVSTIKLYDEDAYQTRFLGKVLSCEKTEKGGATVYETVLDKTLFFPEEGGQTPDRGVIGDVKVLDVQIKKDKETGAEIIYHYLEQPLKEGECVEGVIDFAYRFSNMQQHSGEHIFSGIVNRIYGFENVGFHLSDQIVTMDFNGVLTEEQVLAVEAEVNRAIYQNVCIKTGYPTKEELEKLEYRSKKEIDGAIRIVEVEGYDVCACCAPHVRRTGEIGMLKVMSVQNYKGGIRISFLCGERALAAFNEKCRIVDELVCMMSTSQENIASNIEKLKLSNQKLKGQLSSANQKLLDLELATLDFSSGSVILFKTGIEGNALRTTTNRLMEQCDGFCGVFSGDDENGYNFVIGSNSCDCKELASKLKDVLAARGGGSTQMIQGSVNATEAAIREVIYG